MEFKDIKVNGVTYTTEMSEDILNKQGLMGNVVYYDAKIQISSNLSRERAEQTFIHELTHAIFYEAGYEDQDEDMVNRVGKVLYTTIKDNNFLGGFKK